MMTMEMTKAEFGVSFGEAQTYNQNIVDTWETHPVRWKQWVWRVTELHLWLELGISTVSSME
jgi:hypothetical protein